MKKDFKTRLKDTFIRDIIQKNGGKISYFQIFGLLLIAIGILYFIVAIFKKASSDDIAIAFFITMLGVAFAFPDLLKGQAKELSTMRITVFMFANVICMLLLKIGWGKNVNSLDDIGLDEYWMGVIAFIFGAKATQKYFENVKYFKKSSDETTNQHDVSQGTESHDNINISQIAIAQIAKVQNEGKLHAKFSNIESVSETVKSGYSCLTIYVNDDNIKDIPKFVDAKLNDTTILKVQTEIVTNVGKGIPHIGQLTHDIVDSKTPKFLGSICCVVDSVLYPNFKGVLTSGHIFTKGEYINYGGIVTTVQIRDALSNNVTIGKLYFQEINFAQDIAIVELADGSKLPDKLLSFSEGFYDCTVEDLESDKPNVTILSKDSKREAYILDFNFTRQVYYGSNPKYVTNLILIGSTNDKNTSKTVSKGGDSGSCVYHTKTGKMIGMLLGGDDKFSFVLPFDETLNTNNFKLI